MLTQTSNVNAAKPSCSQALIVGGGPAGLATALMLAKRGWTQITVLEKQAAADYYEPDKSFNYQIDGRGQKLTDLLGITEELSTISVANTDFYLTRIQPNSSRKTVKLPFVDPNRKPAYWIPRRTFVQLLYQEIERNWKDQITVSFSTQAIRINQTVANEEGIKKLEVFALCEDGGKTRFEPSLLVGCDGIRSVVRNTLNQWEGNDSERFKMTLFPSPSSGLRYKVLSLQPKFPLDLQAQEQAVSTMSYAIRGAFRDGRQSISLGLLPLKDPEAPRTANIITRPKHQVWELKTGEEVLNFFNGAFPQLPISQIVSLEEAERFAKSEGGSFPIPQFCRGLHFLLKPASGLNTTDVEVDNPSTIPGIVLLGDAIHCFPPDIGQGVNSALEDVYVLNRALSENSDCLSLSLPRYEALRSPEVNALVRLAQTAAPWQYNQDRLWGRLWTINFILRLGLSKLLPFLSPPAFLLIQNQELSYQEIWGREQRTTRILSVFSLVLLSGLLLWALLLVFGFNGFTTETVFFVDGGQRLI